MMSKCVRVLLLMATISNTVQTAGFTGALPFNIQVCTSKGNCAIESNGLEIDYTWRCPDPRTCKNVISASTYASWGITDSTNALSFYFKPTNGASLMMTTRNGSNLYRMFYLLNRELSFTIDLSTVGCGQNAALFFTSMQADGGMKSYGYTGPMYGTGYCDAQAPVPPYRQSCAEMDVWEGNSLSAMYTTHGCDSCIRSICDAYGCGFNPYQLGNKTFYGRGSKYQLDTTKPFTVVTQFVTDNGLDSGNLKQVQRFYVQNGKTINNPTFQGYSSLSDAFCTTFSQWNAHGVTAGMTSGMRKGMVLIMSLWGDTADSMMQWLDAGNNGPCPVYTNANANVTFSNLKFGPIGSTA